MGVEAGDSEGWGEATGSGARGWESWGVRLECKPRGLPTFTISGLSWERRGDGGLESGFERLWAGVAWLVGIKGGGGEWEGARFGSEEAVRCGKLVEGWHGGRGEGERDV